MMRKRINILAVLMMVLAMVAPLSAPLSAQAQDARTLTSMDFNIVGVTLSVGPEYQAVPKGITSVVTTGFVSNGAALPDNVLAMLPKDFKVIGEFSGPTYTTPVILTTTPGNPFALPSLPILGKYTLSNIRLVDASGNALFAATPQVVTVESISDPLITSVTTRTLTLAELNDRGVVFDSSNFTAYEFTAGIGLESNQQPMTFPVLIPNSTTDVNESPEPTGVGLATPAYNNNLNSTLPDNFSLSGFIMERMPGEKGDYSLPPIPGIIIIPNNIGFLHQYFSALLIVTNGAPNASSLIVKNLTATVTLPAGEDQVAGTDAVPGDDPLRMAKGASDYFPRTMNVMNAGPDGKNGTADDVGLLNPSESGQADFTIEGLKEGAHKLMRQHADYLWMV
jgi:hypothetical protein